MALEITWYGHSCFRIIERSQLSIITDPFDESIGLPLPKWKADVVTMSHDAPGHNNYAAVKGYSHVLPGAGEYEIGGVFIYGVALNYVRQTVVKPNIAFAFTYGPLTALHLGNLEHVPDQSTIEALGEVNVALVPVGANVGVTAEVIALIEPNYIVPMHYAQPGLHMSLTPLDKFLKEMGVSKVQEEDVLRVSAATLPEQPQVVVLRPQVVKEAVP